MPVRSAAIQRREPPIVAAARSGNAEMVGLLLAHGADPTRAASDLSDAFQAALLNDDTAVLEVLLASSIRPVPSGVGFALGHWAAVLNAKACLLRLAKRGKKGWARDSLGRTPLHVACARSQPDVLRALLDSLPEDQRARWLAEFDDRGRNGLPALDALLHRTRMDPPCKVGEPHERFAAGDQVYCRVTQVDIEAKRLSVEQCAKPPAR